MINYNTMTPKSLSFSLLLFIKAQREAETSLNLTKTCHYLANHSCKLLVAVAVLSQRSTYLITFVNLATALWFAFRRALPATGLY